MHIPFPVEVLQESASDPELAEASRDLLKEMQPAMERQTLYFSIAYPIMWVSFLANSCYITARINWWFGYAYLVILTLACHLLFRYAFVTGMQFGNLAERLTAYVSCFFYRTVIVCTFTMIALTSLATTAILYNGLEPLMTHPPESAAIHPAKGQTATTNANANAAIPTDPTQSTTATEKHTKKTAELLKDFEGGGGMFQ